MPRLSPSMTRATIEKWHLRPAQFANSYQLALEVSTDDLTADAEIDKTVPVNDSDTDSQRKKPRHFLDIEILEDMYVARLLGIEGRSYLAGEPIALFCDDEKDILPAEGVDVSLIPTALSPLLLYISSGSQVTICKDAYQYANGTQMVLWQGFVKENDVNRCSCG